MLCFRDVNTRPNSFFCSVLSAPTALVHESARLQHKLCSSFVSNTQIGGWISGGDGPKRLILEEVREEFQLHDRVAMLGTVEHSRVRDVSSTSHVYVWRRFT